MSESIEDKKQLNSNELLTYKNDFLEYGYRINTRKPHISDNENMVGKTTYNYRYFYKGKKEVSLALKNQKSEKLKAPNINVFKLLQVTGSYFTAQNSEESWSKGTKVTEITISRSELLGLLGYESLTTSQKQVGYRSLNATLRVLKECFISWDKEDIKPIKKIESTRTNITFYFTEVWAESLIISHTLSPINKKLLEINPHPQKENIFKIGTGLQGYYNIKSNIKRGTNDRLKVKTILSYTTLRSYEDIKAKGSWTRDIKNPIEKALNSLQSDYNFLKSWSYEESKNNFNGYQDWANTLIFFELVESPYEVEKEEKEL